MIEILTMMIKILLPPLLLFSPLLWWVLLNARNYRRQHVELATSLCDSGSWKLSWGSYPVTWFIDGKINGHPISHRTSNAGWTPGWTCLQLTYPVKRTFKVYSRKELGGLEERLRPFVGQIFSDMEVRELHCRSEPKSSGWIWDVPQWLVRPPGLMLVKYSPTTRFDPRCRAARCPPTGGFGGPVCLNR